MLVKIFSNRSIQIKLCVVGDEQAFDKYVRRTVRVTREHNDDCKRLLGLMGVPYVDAPTEAEARKIG